MKLHNVHSKGDRLDVYLLSLFSDITRSKIQSLIKSQKILIDGNPSKSSYILKGTELISYSLDELLFDITKKNIISEKINLNILYEDDCILVINKQSGLVVHPGAGNHTGTLLNGVINKINQKLFNSTPGIVHRLDKETTGVIIVAKDFKSHSFISKQFEARTVKKFYNALVWGETKDHGVIKGNIIRNNRNRKTFRLTSDKGRYSETKYKTLNRYGPFSFIELIPKTGRTHQIRVHMKSIGHPIVSDPPYSGGKSMIKSFHVKYSPTIKRVLKTVNRVALHAKSIEIVNPSTQEKKKFTAPIPEDINEVINLLNKNESL